MPTGTEIEARIIENRILKNREPKPVRKPVSADIPQSPLSSRIGFLEKTPNPNDEILKTLLNLGKGAGRGIIDLPQFAVKEAPEMIIGTLGLGDKPEEQQPTLGKMARQMGSDLIDVFAVTAMKQLNPEEYSRFKKTPKGQEITKMISEDPFRPLMLPLLAMGGLGKGAKLAGKLGKPKPTITPKVKISPRIIETTRVGSIKGKPVETSLPKIRSDIIINEKALDILREQPKIDVESVPRALKNDVSIEKFTEALKGAKPVRKAQELLYSKERAARLGRLRAIQEKTTGEAGFHAELGQLKGELPKVDFESIRGKLVQSDIDNLFNRVKDANVLTEWEKITAREGLSKMLTEHGGRVPTRGELILLEQVFPANFMEAVMGRRPFGAKLKEGILQTLNIPRSIMASFDLSFGGRQGAFAAPKFRKAFWDSWKSQFKIFGSEKAYQASRDALISDPDFLFAKKSKVPFTEVGKILIQREEKFQSQWAEKIPLVGRGVKASGRAYTAFANKYRLDIFKQLVKDIEAMGAKPRENPYLAQKMGEFVGNATGRGSLGGFENAAVVLNSFFFSPRLNMARLRLLNPVHYVNQPKYLRKQMLSTALHAGGAATTILTVAKLGGLDVTADPRSADFGKIKTGNTRIDMLAGFGQFIRGAAQIATGQYISTTTGKLVNLGEGYRPLTRMDLIIRQIESKESPIASFATGILRDKNWAGEEFNIPKEIGSRFVPMVVQDIYDLAEDDPSLIPLAIPATFGIGLQTYQLRKKRRFPARRLGK